MPVVYAPKLRSVPTPVIALLYLSVAADPTTKFPWTELIVNSSYAVRSPTTTLRFLPSELLPIPAVRTSPT